MANTVGNMFTGTLSPKDLTAYTLMRGVTDFSNLVQFNNFETGYSFLIVLNIPKFLDTLATQNDEYAKLINTYRHILEYDFRGISGFEDMTSESSEITNGTSSVNVITKVNYQSASTFTMRYFERNGLVLSKVNELFLRGIKDPKTQVKTYDGLLRGPDGTANGAQIAETGYENEYFEFLYFVTDNSCRDVEKAFLITAAQPTTAALAEVTNSEKGTIGWAEVDMSFQGVPLTNPAINAKAVQFLNWINQNTVFEEMHYGYQAVANMKDPNDLPYQASSSKVDF